ncbi:hypothetical protein SLA2020_318810 [Shorea laevis]
MESHNSSLLAKLGWMMTTNQPLLWVDCLRACGLNVDVWNSPWLPLMPDFKARPNSNLVSLPEFSVADLITPGSRSWNLQLLSDLFDPPTVQSIISIHLPQNFAFDKWSWVASPSGRFVSSADDEAWVCPFCKGPPETLSHIFLECDLARILWRSSPWPILISVFSAKPISEWILAVIHPKETLGIPISDIRKFQLFAALTMDFIWMARNKLVHEDIQPTPSSAIRQIFSSLDSHCAAWRDAALPSLWSPPPVGHIKGNFDVAVNGSFAVAAALLAMKGPALFSSWTIANCISDVSLALSSFRSWNASKVSRCANFRAHALAKWAASNLVFGSILTGSPILSSIRIRSGKDPPL